MELHPLKIRFYPKLKSGSKDRYVLYMRMTMAGMRTDIALSYELRKNCWSEKDQSLNHKHKDRGYVLHLTNQYRQRAQEIYQQLIQRNLDCDLNVIRQKLTGNQMDDSDNSFKLLSSFDRLIERKRLLGGPNNTKATVFKYKCTKKHLENFLHKKYFLSDIKFNRIDLRFIEDFEFYLKTEAQSCHNTTMKHIRTFKTVFKAALAHGYTDKDPFQKFKIKYEEVIRDFLSEGEIERIMEVDLPPNKLSNVRDIFIFSCFTGLSYIDIKNLTLQNLKKENGYFWIRTRRQKTNIKSNVPLLKTPLGLVRKYCPGFETKSGDERIFRVISNQKMNKYLKELAELCNIQKHLTCHIARHTFATTITLNNGVPIESVSSMLGHRHITTTQHYAKLLDKKLGEDMERLGQKLAIKSNW